MQAVKGISPGIDSCAGLLMQQAMGAYRHLSAEHKRWVDPEDLLQQALMEAVKAERPGRFQEGAGSKFSTYLYTGLRNELSKSYTDRLRQQKRTSFGIVELDAPVPGKDNDAKMELPSPMGDAVDYLRVRRGIAALEALCRGCSATSRILLVRGLLFGLPLRAEELGRLAEAQGVAKRLGIQWGDLTVFQKSEKSRRLALIQLVRGDIVGSADTDARVLECIECSGQFPLSAIREGRYVVSTMTCRACYRALKKSPGRCFGKVKGGGIEGYSAEDVECSTHCMDREVCKAVISKQGVGKTMVDTELDDVEFDATEKPAKKAASKAVKGKTEKAVKAAKASKKAKEEDDDPAPAEVGKWPFKNGSVMRWMFQTAYAGIKREAFDAAMKKSGRLAKTTIDQWLKVLRSGKTNNKAGAPPPTHTWKLNEEDWRLKITDVKYHGKAARKVADGTKAATETAKPAKKVEKKAEKPAVAKKATKVKAKAVKQTKKAA